MKLKQLLKRYKGVIVTLVIFLAFIFVFPEKTTKAGESLLSQIKIIVLVLPPVFILLGLLDVWIPRELMIRLMGSESGVKGSLIAFLLGSAAAGPLYGAFPVAVVLMKKGAGFFNVLVFIGAWSTTKIPMLLFEINAMGYRFALSRLAIDIIGIIIIASLLNRLLPESEIKRIYANAVLTDNDAG